MRCYQNSLTLIAVGADPSEVESLERGVLSQRGHQLAATLVSHLVTGQQQSLEVPGLTQQVRQR